MTQIIQTPGFNIPSDPATREKIKKKLYEISGYYTQIEAQRDLIKRTVEGMSEEYEIPKPALNKLARTFHKQNYQEVAAENEKFEILYESIINK